MPLFLFGTSFVALLCSAFLFSLIFISVELYSRLIAILLECVFFNPLEPEEVKLGLLQKLRSMLLSNPMASVSVIRVNPKYTRAFRDSITVTPFLFPFLHEVIIGLILGDG